MKSPIWAIGASAGLVAIIVGVLYYFNIHEALVDLLRWIDARGNWAALLFTLVMALAVVLLLPGLPLTTGAGFVFGLVEGTLYVVIGTTLGSICAFLIARHLFGQRARAWILAHSKLHTVTDEMAAHDLKVVLLTRLIPFFPGKLSNYFFGLTRFSLRGFALGSLIGFVPFSLHNVYIGSLAASFVMLGEQEFGRTPLEWGIYSLGFIATVVAVVFFNRLARRSLAHYSPEVSQEGESL